MTPPIKAVAPVDFAVIAAYMALMLAIGVYWILWLQAPRRDLAENAKTLQLAVPR